MKSTAKAAALARDLNDKLKARYSGSAQINSIRQANDSAGWPMLFLSNSGTETAGASVIAIRISSQDAVSKDVFGNALVSFNPHLIEVSYELTATDNPIPTDKDLAIASLEVDKLGMRKQIKENANGTAVTEASMNAATPLVDLDSDVYWPNKGV